MDLTAPIVDDDGRPFWEGTTQHRLLIQSCGRCGRLRFPPRPVCPHCRSFDAEWFEASGSGAIWSFVVTHPPVLPAYEPFTPFVVAVVELDEDPAIRLVGHLVTGPRAAINSVDPRSISIGDPVRVTFPVATGGFVVPRWVPTR